jgi:hypothetical protein
MRQEYNKRMFGELSFLPAPDPVSYFLLLKLFPPTSYPQLSLTHLLTYKFKLKVDSSHLPTHLYISNVLLSSPPTYSPLTYLSTCPSTFLPINTLSKYLPDLAYMVTPTYMVATPIDPPIVDSDEERIK